MTKAILFPKSSAALAIAAGLVLSCVVLSCLALSETARAAMPGLTCKPERFQGSGFHYTKDGATRRALVDWQNKVTAAYGPTWAGWGRSAQRAISCTFNPSQTQHGWYCEARAHPCRYRDPGVTPYRFRAPHPARPGIRQEFRRQ